MMNLDIEKEIFKRFLQNEKVDRFYWMLESPKRRQRIFDDLRDIRYFEKDTCEELTGQEKNTSNVLDRLKKLGISKTVYVICSDEEYDGSNQPLEQFISEKLWEIEDMLVYCRKSKIGLFKNHEGWFYILSKR